MKRTVLVLGLILSGVVSTPTAMAGGGIQIGKEPPVEESKPDRKDNSNGNGDGQDRSSATASTTPTVAALIDSVLQQLGLRETR